MTSLGTEPLLSADPSVMDKASLVIAPYGFSDFCLPPMGVPTFAMGCGRMGMTLDDAAVLLPKEYLQALPKGISPCEFAAACFESGRAPALGKLVPAYLRQSGKKITLADAGKQIVDLTF